MNFAHYAVGLCLTGLGISLGLRPRKLGGIGFGVPGGAEPKESPPLPQWIGLFVAAELFAFGTAILAWDAVARRGLFVMIGALLFLITWTMSAIVAGVSAQQQSWFTSKTASRVRNYRVAAFVYAAIGFALLFLFFLLPLIRHY